MTAEHSPKPNIPINIEDSSDEAMQLLESADIRKMADLLGDPIAVWQPSFDGDAQVNDATLLWSNKAWQKYRHDPVEPGALMTEIFVRPRQALTYLDRAWKEGQSDQLFIAEYKEFDDGVYNPDVIPAECHVTWQKTGERIVETSVDRTAQRKADRRLEVLADSLAQSESKRNIAEERERIARDLHDTVIQDLIAVSLGLRLAHTEAGESPTDVSPTIDALEELVGQIRSVIFDMKDHGPIDFQRSVLGLIEGTARSLGYMPEYELPEHGSFESVDQRIVSELISTLRESLSNITRHAKSSYAKIIVELSDTHVNLEVIDDGIGIGENPKNGMGLSNMKTRAELLGGTFKISDREKYGTSLTWSVPLHNFAHEAEYAF